MRLLGVLSYKSTVFTVDWSKATQLYQIRADLETRESGCEEEVAVGELQRKMVRG